MQKYRFGEFELDLDALQLRRLGVPVKLERRPLDLLILLVRQHGQLVARESIIADLWPKNVIIDFDSGLNTLVRKVRSALGDDPDNPRFIETIPGRGYRFIARISDDLPISAQERPTRPRLRYAALVVGLGLAILIGFGLRTIEFGGDADIRIAVLPFDNLTESSDLGYLASGLAEETSTSLAQIDPENVAVIGMISSRAFARTEMPLRQIGRDFDVDYVVASSLRLERPIIRVTSQLIRVSDSEQLWSASFDRELTNVLGLQREISIAIAEQVRMSLSPDVAAAIDRRQTSNPVAYELYLKGRYEWTQLSPASLRRAIDYYRQAVDLDPGYALAWAGMAHALAASPMTADTEPEKVLQATRDAVERALQSGSDLAEVQYAEGYYEFFVRWDWGAAEIAARQAVALDPNNGIAHMLLGMVLSQTGQDLEAREMLRRARELEPLFPLTYANSAYVETAAGTPREGIEYARQAIAINPEFWVGYLQLGNTLIALDEPVAALDAFTMAARYSEDNSKAVSSRAFLLAQLGREEEAETILDDLTTLSTSEYVPPYAVAVVHLGLGNIDETYEWLERALAARDVHLLGLPTDAHFRALHDDPRYRSLLVRGGLERQPANL
jgi:TolB-like protein/DNA-binding winged helix-turn-helix (wHTH) protein/Flp pilus assembly protein TadD